MLNAKTCQLGQRFLCRICVIFDAIFVGFGGLFEGFLRAFRRFFAGFWAEFGAFAQANYRRDRHLLPVLNHQTRAQKARNICRKTALKTPRSCIAAA